MVRISYPHIHTVLSGAFLLVLLVYAGYDAEWTRWLPSLALAGIYPAMGLGNGSGYRWQIARFCLGEALTGAIWLLNPLLGVIAQALVFAGFLPVQAWLRTGPDRAGLVIWVIGTGLIAYYAGFVQHTYLLLVAVLTVAWIALVCLALAEYRIQYHAGGGAL